MKLEVGMHVRTKRRTLQPPQIARIINISKDVVLNQYFIELDKNLIPSYKHHIYEEDIENANHSLIELVKVGDYVNGKEIGNIIYNKKGRTALISKDYEWCDLCNDFEHYVFSPEDIKTIFTKEQFEVMVYNVGGSNE